MNKFGFQLINRDVVRVDRKAGVLSLFIPHPNYNLPGKRGKKAGKDFGGSNVLRRNKIYHNL